MSQQHHHYFSLKALKIFRLHGLWGIYLNTAFRDLGLALIDIFIPLYLYKISQSLTFTFLFFAVYHLAVLPGAWLAGRLAQRVGLDWLEFISTITRTFFLLLLMLAEKWLNLVWPAAILWGLTIPFCWLPYHYTLVEKCEETNFGQTVSKMDIISKIMVGLGPFLGGLLIFSFGFPVLYFVAILFFLFSGVVIFFDDFNRKKMRLNFEKILKRFGRPNLRPFWIGLIGKGIEIDISGIVWPLYIFFVLSSYTTLGAIQSVSFFVMILTLWLVGRWVDKKGVRILNYGVMGGILNWLIRPFLVSSSLLFFSDLSYKLFSILVWVPLMTVTYQKATQMHRLEFFIQREWILHLTGGVTSFLLAILIGIFRLSWSAFFALGILGLLFCTLVTTPRFKEK